jgi:predicted MFS family arabinose efflux permease
LAAPEAAGGEGRLILLLSLGAFGSAMSMRVADAQLPALASHFHLGLAAVAQVITFFSVGYGLAQLGYGPWGDRVGKWRVIALAVLASAVSAAACALAPGFVTLVIARVLAGITCAGIIPLSMAWIGDAVSYDRRQPVLARFLTGQILGMGAGQWLGGVAADFGQWRLPFAALAVWFVVAGVLLWRARGAGQARSPGRPGSAHPVAELGAVLRQPWARVVLTVVFTEGVLLFGAHAFFPTHLHQTHGLSLSAAGAIVTTYASGGLIFAAASRQLVGRLGETGLARAGAVLTAAGLLLLALSPVWWTALPACVGAGLGFYMLHNTLQTNATQMAPQARGAAVALFASAFFLGQTVGVALMAVAVERAGTAVGIAACAPLLLALGLRFAAMRRDHAGAG